MTIPLPIPRGSADHLVSSLQETGSTTGILVSTSILLVSPPCSGFVPRLPSYAPGTATSPSTARACPTSLSPTRDGGWHIKVMHDPANHPSHLRHIFAPSEATATPQTYTATRPCLASRVATPSRPAPLPPRSKLPRAEKDQEPGTGYASYLPS